tara:strand:- start:598 stop:915 length:318 start_codon:yes stop_codon:yes gene_type:complete
VNILEELIKREFLSDLEDALANKIEIDGHELNWIDEQLHNLQDIQCENVDFSMFEVRTILKLTHKVYLVLIQSIWQNQRFQNVENLFTLNKFKNDLEEIKKHFTM